jgi:23S rRNA (uridine2552-2'-O)-methyltransferase
MIDKFSLKSRQEGYLARSVYKLIFLNKKYRIIKKNDNVLDLGCFPGSWLQVINKVKVNAVGVDIKQISNIPNVKFILGNVREKETINKIRSYGKFDVVLSDLAPNTSGNKSLDQERSLELSEIAFNIAKDVLKHKGNFVCKIFQSKEFNEFLNKVKKNFYFVKSVKPEASKKESKEMYIVALGYKT